MDLRSFYQKIREIADGIKAEHVVVISHPTPDGGKAGVPMEVARMNAARLIAEGRARLASAGESDAFRALLAEASERAEQELAASRMQITVVTEPSRVAKEKNNPKKG